MRVLISLAFLIAIAVATPIDNVSIKNYSIKGLMYYIKNSGLRILPLLKLLNYYLHMLYFFIDLSEKERITENCSP